MIEEYLNKQLFLQSTDLCRIMTKHGSDKGRGGAQHNYTTFYNFLFESKRYDKLNVLEIGMGSTDKSFEANMAGYGTPGGSIKGWKEYFPFANIYGADIDSKILFQEERIKTYFCDQRKKELVRGLFDGEELRNIEFDIIIDDGHHELHNVNIPFLEMIEHKLKKGGLYIIEDIYERLFDDIARNFVIANKNKYEFIEYIKIPLPENGGDNNVILIKK